jgi:hypothetical protein
MSEREEAMKRHPSYTEPVDETNEPEWVMNANDRCDKCYAQAYYLTKLEQGYLYWCRHHFLENEAMLRAYSYEVIDESIKLEPKKVEEHA